ncbi:MAG: RNA polymerase subunit sigma-24 [Firmicutes bacterium HGW-Firmicutes-21]|nr:MAG: RNA polymerase subunit sigma-24 [Firmicutes bacterium HGW-Firmicutes-21]
MKKQEADRIITEYTKKLFGFALSKTGNISQAEELASLIILEVYTTLLNRENIANINGYIYRISQNVYARFIDEAKRSMHLSLDEVTIPAENDFADDIIQGETYRLLRSEITYLSRTQREIVVLHYYDKLKLDEISKRLSIPLGTVKWHLYEAKNSLKERLNCMRTKGNLGVKPIEFCSMGHSGSPGSMGDTSDFLKKRLTQNIAYAAYHEAKTINEIAEELGVSPLFIEDEVAVLEEYGFMDKVSGGKFLTNILIIESTKEICEQEHVLNNKYAKIVCEKYVPLLFETMRDYKEKEIYIPDNDFNYLMWSVITYAIGYKLVRHVDYDSFSIKRKDGGDYIAIADMEMDFKVSFDWFLYGACGDMTRVSEKYPMNAWQLDTYYDSRSGGWRDSLTSDYEFLYEFITGALKKEECQIEKFQRLYKKGYLLNNINKDEVNVVIIKDGGKNWMTNNKLANILPAVTDELIEIGKEFDDEMYRLKKVMFPAHMQKLCKARTNNCLSSNSVRTRVLEQLLASGMLKQPTEKQKHGLNTIMFCDTLPIQ